MAVSIGLTTSVPPWALSCASMMAKPLRIGRASASLPSAKTSENAARAEVRWS
jgi:hypothetical protein